MEYLVFGLDSCGYYKRVVKTAREVRKIVETGTVEQIVKVVKIEHRWGGDHSTDFKVPTDWTDDSDYSAFKKSLK